MEPSLVQSPRPLPQLGGGVTTDSTLSTTAGPAETIHNASVGGGVVSGDDDFTRDIPHLGTTHLALLDGLERRGREAHRGANWRNHGGANAAPSGSWRIRRPRTRPPLRRGSATRTCTVRSAPAARPPAHPPCSTAHNTHSDPAHAMEADGLASLVALPAAATQARIAGGAAGAG